MENFDFRFCDVAQFIIKNLQKNEEILRHRNGKPTQLYIHAVDCQKCNGATIYNVDRIHDGEIKNGFIKIELKTLKDFGKWIKKYHPEATESTALYLLMNYYEYAYNVQRPLLIRYQQKYGDLK